MGDKSRDLPSWMLKSDSKQGEPEKTFKSHRKTKKTRLERVTLYCMNEAELVDTALSLLRDAESGGDSETESRVSNSKAEKAEGCHVRTKRTLVMVSDVEEESSDCEAGETTYVSETDLEEMAEAATLPYAVAKEQEHHVPEEDALPGAEGPRGQGFSEASGRSTERAELPLHGRTADPDHGRDSHGTSDEDPLQLVREIFFT